MVIEIHKVYILIKMKIFIKQNMGLMAVMLGGVRASIALASLPTASTFLVPDWMATTEGSRMTMPRSFKKTNELAVPKSIPISLENRPFIPSNI